MTSLKTFYKNIFLLELFLRWTKICDRNTFEQTNQSKSCNILHRHWHWAEKWKWGNCCKGRNIVASTGGGGPPWLFSSWPRKASGGPTAAGLTAALWPHRYNVASVILIPAPLLAHQCINTASKQQSSHIFALPRHLASFGPFEDWSHLLLQYANTWQLPSLLPLIKYIITGEGDRNLGS